MRFKFDQLFASEALLLGRLTDEEFAAAWPSVTDEQGFADRMCEERTALTGRNIHPGLRCLPCRRSTPRRRDAGRAPA